MSNVPDSLRSRIVALSEEMAAAADAGEWSRASDLGNLRRDLLETLFATTEDRAEEAELVADILRSDRMLVELAQTARSEVSEALAEHRNRRRALGAYRDAASAEI